jgi:predicted nucleic acid-binding protein
MSTLEMKAKAFEKLASINEESAIKEVLLFLENLKETKDEFDADTFFKNASEKYDDVLQKLAQ